jgi:predicted DCC family thiol-disulfide oxidoreductase YuxK
VRERLALPDDLLLAEMRVLTVSGHVLGGADALLYLAHELGASRRVWWPRPLTIVSKLPLVMPVLRFAYRWVARRRYCGQGACRFSAAGNLKKEETR